MKSAWDGGKIRKELIQTNDDEIIAAYIREKRPEILDTLSYRFFWVGYRIRKYVETIVADGEDFGEDVDEIGTKETVGDENDESGN